MQTLSRKQLETLMLAVIALLSVAPLRVRLENRLFFAVEFLAIFTAMVFGLRKSPLAQRGGIVALLAIPILFALAARMWATPIVIELTALTFFGNCAIAMACRGQTNRWRSLALVSSGFLILFCATISDSRYAIILPMAWMLGCVWHLIANHWERLDLAMPDSVSRPWTLRPGVVVLTAVVLGVAGFAVRDRFPVIQKLTAGIMPTSGGSKWSDPAARSGVGTGDAAIAAKDHAESFGAVDSEIFLESTQSTLFDMANDSIGEAKKKNKWEKRQGMNNEKIIPMHEMAAKTEKGGSSFSTDRLPPKQHRHFEESRDPGVVQWDGPTGIRLAMQRFDTFDGVDWSQTEDLGKKELTRAELGEALWFLDPSGTERREKGADRITVGLLKTVRLDSNRIPSPMLTEGVHIKKIDRIDFFGIEKDGSFFMPGRDQVPPLTVLHIASLPIMEDEVIKRCQSRTWNDRARTVAWSDIATRRDDPNLPVARKIKSIADRVTKGQTTTYDKLTAIVQHLRTEFTFDRDAVPGAGNPVEQFLEQRRGGDHLFATTAAMMVREIGLPTRLTYGFYVRPEAFDITAGHSSVLPSDIHYWVEVQLLNGQWIEIEPTPTYLEPQYQPSFWLVCKRMFALYWPVGLLCACGLTIAIITRKIWIDYLLGVIWAMPLQIGTRLRIRLAMGVIETRARLAGHRRPIGIAQRDWIENLIGSDAVLSAEAGRFFDLADACTFGSRSLKLQSSDTRLVRMLRTRTFSRLSKEAAE